jgi:hypothetical protein
MGKARSTVASVFLSFLPRFGLVLQHLRLQRTALHYFRCDGSFEMTAQARPHSRRLEISSSLKSEAINANIFK